MKTGGRLVKNARYYWLLLSDVDRRRLAALVFLHDIGKLHPDPGVGRYHGSHLRFPRTRGDRPISMFATVRIP